MILVTGATGAVGRHVVRLLVEANEPVRAMTRDPAKAKLEGALVVRGDYDEPASVVAAMQGVEKLFLLSLGPKLGEHEAHAVQAARGAGVKQVVKLSTYGVDVPELAIAKWHGAGEEAVKASGLQWTLLRPTGFMSNALGWVGGVKGQGAVYGVHAAAKVSPIHPVDIAAVAAKVLTSAGHAGKTYLLSGPEVIDLHEQVKVLGEAIGKALKAVEVPGAKLRENMLASGRPAVMVDAVVALMEWARTRGAGMSSDEVPRLLGRPATGWAQWCRENAAAFQ